MNPYWDAVHDKVVPPEFPWEGPHIERFKFECEIKGVPDTALNRDEFVGKYSWTVTDPHSVDFVAAHAEAGLVDPMAGTGYWAYVLRQEGIDVVSYDLNTPDTNHWHMDETPWVDITQLDAEVAVAKHPDRTLFLAWPPYSDDAGYRAVKAYQGRRVIYLGEEYGCTGDDALRELFDNEWEAIATRMPIRWWGLRDDITVYERKS